MTADESTGGIRQESNGVQAEATERATDEFTLELPIPGESGRIEPGERVAPVIDDGSVNPGEATRPAVGTAIGMDVGEKRLATLAPATDAPRPTEYRIVTHDRDEAAERYELLCRKHAAAITFDAARDPDAVAFRETVRRGAAVESLSWRPRPSRWHITRNSPLCEWLLPALQATVCRRARRTSVPVVSVGGSSTVQCHRCAQLGVASGETVRCGAASCPVEQLDRDVGAAVTLARRV